MLCCEQLPLMSPCCSVRVCSLPELLDLKQRLMVAGGAAFSAVFMTGSGSTLVCVGSDAAPQFLSDPKHQVRRMWGSRGRQHSICASKQRTFSTAGYSLSCTTLAIGVTAYSCMQCGLLQCQVHNIALCLTVLSEQACPFAPLHQDLFVSPARLIVRKPDSWYVPARPGVWSP